MCLASVLHHRGFISSLSDNHVVRLSSMVLRTNALVTFFDTTPDYISVMYPWNAPPTLHFSGIPPHVVTLQELYVVQQEQSRLIDDFVARMGTLLDERGIEGGRLTEARLRELLAEGLGEIQDRIDALQVRVGGAVGGGGGGGDAPVEGAVGDVQQRQEQGPDRYTLHLYDGWYHRLPKTWRFPRCGVLDLWRQWNIGDTVRNIPPLRFLTHQDVKFVDKLPLDEEEQHARVGNHKESRRKSFRNLYDMRFLCGYIKRRCEEKGVYTAVHTIQTVDAMYREIEAEFSVRQRDAQKRWRTFVSQLQRLPPEE